MADTSRVLVYSPQDVFITEISPNDIFERIRTEELNGEHKLDLTTTVKLHKEQRILTLDAMGVWREYVITGEDTQHLESKRAIGTYRAVWSLQHDLQGVPVSKMPNNKTAAAALDDALSTTARWSRGTVTVSTVSSGSMYQRSAWEALGVLVNNWGGEIEPNIMVDSAGVVSRKVNFFAHTGKQTATRRFDYSHDLVSIKRKVAEDAMFCRVIPLGKGEETETGGYGRKITIASVNSGIEWLENSESAAVYRLPDGLGGYEYPTGYIENNNISDPQALKDWALSVIDDWTMPKVTYEADVLQIAEAGLDAQGIALGDAVQCVDLTFGEEPLRVNGRVVKLVTNELDSTDVRVTIGNLSEGMADLFREIKTDLSRTKDVALAAQSGTMTTAEYLDNLLEHINEQINASGGYVYITDGNGMRTYDVPVTYDSETGTWYDSNASKVTEIKGGTIRIAASKDGSGNWQWKTVFEAGHIAADIVTTAHLTAGYIGNASGDFYIDLDNNIFRMPATSVGSTQLLDDTDVSGLTKVAAFANRYFSDASNTSITPGFYPCTDPPISGLTTMQRYIISTAGNTYKDLVFYNSSQDAIEYEDGETYTVSCYARVVNGTKAVIEMRCTALGVLNTQGNIEITNTDWVQYHWTAKANAALGQFKLYVGVHGTYAATVEICGIKLERGSNATDWMPSVADLLHSMATAAYAAVDAQTQSDIFNKLTDNGVIQGLYMDNGQLYINSEYINTAALISPKVGNSATEYARIGSFQYNNLTYSGIEFFINGGNQATLVYGVCDIPAGQSGAGTYVIIGVGYEGGFWPIYLGTNTSGGTFVLRGLPVKKADGNFISPQLRMTAYGVYADYDTVSRTIATF